MLYIICFLIIFFFRYKIKREAHHIYQHITLTPNLTQYRTESSQGPCKNKKYDKGQFQIPKNKRQCNCRFPKWVSETPFWLGLLCLANELKWYIPYSYYVFLENICSNLINSAECINGCKKEAEKIIGPNKKYGRRVEERIFPAQKALNETFETFTSKNFSWGSSPELTGITALKWR